MAEEQAPQGTNPSPNQDVTILERPTLRQPILLAAFEGWNDAAEGATAALEFLRENWDATEFASIEAEEFYDFTEVRPMVRLNDNRQRRIEWPTNTFAYYNNPKGDRDFIIFIGVEPSLKWRRFTNAFLSVAHDFKVSSLITVGALLSDVPHGRPARVNVTATDPRLQQQLGRSATRPSRYEGPTGITGVISDAASQAGMVGASCWGQAPHYLSASPNPMVTLSILRRLDSLLDLDLNLSEMEGEAEAFVAQVNEAVAQDPEATSYINSLESQGDEDDDDDDDDDPEPFRRHRNTGQGLIQDVEDFLRRRRTNDE